MKRRPPAAALAVLLSLAAATGAGATVVLPDPQPFAATDAPASRAAAAGMIAVPAGVYPIGDDRGPRDQRPAHVVRLDAFRIDRLEVTNAAFAEFLNALPLRVAGSARIGGVSAANFPGGGLDLVREGREGSGLRPVIALDDEQSRIVIVDGRFAAAPGYADHPVAETTWAGAAAYCAWRGARLPSEAEWEAAARGADRRPYPWGFAPPDATRAFVSGRSGQTAPVGGRPAGASAFGALDMSGGLAEWTSSLKRPYPYNVADGREDQAAPGERVTRGGDYVYDTAPEKLSATWRDGFSNAPERGHRHIGFRCAA
jgi:iron(II)-dependent oxidoreductase